MANAQFIENCGEGQTTSCTRRDRGRKKRACEEKKGWEINGQRGEKKSSTHKRTADELEEREGGKRLAISPKTPCVTRGRKEQLFTQGRERND